MLTVLTCSLFLAGTIFLVAVSWRSLHHPRFHGFFRFFAFEASFCIILLNAPVWFHRLFAPLQLVSWLLLIVSAGLAVHGYHVLRQGRPVLAVLSASAMVGRDSPHACGDAQLEAGEAAWGSYLAAPPDVESGG
jgi:hypothetical protein